MNETRSRFRSIGWWVGRTFEISVALLVFYVAVTLIEYRESVAKTETPASEWFVLNELYVPDHKVGDDPLLVYDREILSDHKGFWIAEVQLVDAGGSDGLFQNICTGSGVNDYNMNETLGPDSEVHWTWFFGRPCVVPPGRYRIMLTRDMTKPDWPVKRHRDISNVFVVSE